MSARELVALDPIDPIEWVHVLPRAMPAEFLIRCDRCGAQDVVRHSAALADTGMLARVYASHARCPKPGGAR